MIIGIIMDLMLQFQKCMAVVKQRHAQSVYNYELKHHFHEQWSSLQLCKIRYVDIS